MIHQEQGIDLIYDFPAEIATGQYTLTVATAADTFVQPLAVERYTGPRLSLAGAPDDSTLPTFGRDAGIGLEYTGFAPNALLETSFYQSTSTCEKGTGLCERRLLDSWLVRVGEQGKFGEQLALSPELPPGAYLVATCDVARCQPVFTTLATAPLGPENGLTAPPIAWQEFILASEAGAPSTSNARRCAWPCSPYSEPQTGPLPAYSSGLYAGWEYSGIEPGSRYTLIWRHTVNGEYARYNCRWNGRADGFQRTTLAPPRGVLGGTWELLVLVNDVAVLREQFDVEPGGGSWQPPGVINRCPAL